MQIGSGQAPLSLTMLKTLGTQLTAPKGAAQAGSNPVSVKPVSLAEQGPSQPDPAADLGVAQTIPRGSFVNLKV